MAGNARTDLVTALRSKLSDDRATVAAFVLTVRGNAKSAILDISNGFLNVEVTQGENVKSIRWDLSKPQYATVGRLVSELRKLPGYVVSSETAIMTEHLSQDLRVDGVPDIATKSGGSSDGYTLKHRIFSDEELMDFLNEAVQIHNPNYTIGTVPLNERPYVLKKAAAAAYRVLAADASRRKGLETDVKDLLALIKDLEDQYQKDTDRLKRILPSPKADETKVGPGDIINGSFVRRSARSGYSSPARTALPPVPPKFFDPADDDVEDVLIRLRWSQARDASFSHYEVWRDTQPNVERSLSGRLSPGITGVGELAYNSQYSRASTAVQVFGQNCNRFSPVYDGFYFGTVSEAAGMLHSLYIDGYTFEGPNGGAPMSSVPPIEPETDYYYRVYLFNINGEVAPSDVKKYRTRPLRARFARYGLGVNTANSMLSPTAIYPNNGPIDSVTPIVVQGTNLTGVQVLIGGKIAPIVDTTIPGQITVSSPVFKNLDYRRVPLDVVLLSPSGLKDIAMRAWMFT